MVNAEWKIAKSSLACALCDSKLGIGATYFSALFEQPVTAQTAEGFERRDYCPECFAQHKPEGLYSFWRTIVQEPDEAGQPKRPAMDPEAVLDFFRRLAADESQDKRGFRYVLALMLTRKKILKLQDQRVEADGTAVLEFSLRRGGETFEVIPPDLSEAELDSISSELGQLLGLTPARPAVIPTAAAATEGEASEKAAEAEQGTVAQSTPEEALPG